MEEKKIQIRARLSLEVERGRRLRAGLEFGQDEKIYSVTQEQLETIQEDKYIKFNIMKEKKTPAPATNKADAWTDADSWTTAPDASVVADTRTKAEIIEELKKAGFEEGKHFVAGDKRDDLLEILNSKTNEWGEAI